jgi:hypothetical protein
MAGDVRRVSFPVTCPVCGTKLIAQYRLVDIVGALINGRPIHLYAACHDIGWIASYVEVQRIRSFLGATWLEAQRRADPQDDRESTYD